MATLKDGSWLLSFGRRMGRKLNDEKQECFSDTLKHYGLSLPFDSDILNKQPVWMEIGFGTGDHLLGQALHHPEVLCIGCEPYVSGVANLTCLMQENNITNIRLWQDDARPLLTALPDHILDRVFILFPDPWPKKKHHKRRLISDAFLDLLARVLKPGAELRVATDHPDYAEWTLVHVLRHPAFAWNAESQADWKTPPEDWVSTRYERKARKAGRVPYFFKFVRV